MMQLVLYRATMQQITVTNLRVESITGPTCYRGENGFSALTAYVKCDDVEISKQLRHAADTGTGVVVKCAQLEVEGDVGNLQFAADAAKREIAISVDNLRLVRAAPSQ
jgi:hypothetical protein